MGLVLIRLLFFSVQNYSCSYHSFFFFLFWKPLFFPFLKIPLWVAVQTSWPSEAPSDLHYPTALLLDHLFLVRSLAGGDCYTSFLILFKAVDDSWMWLWLIFWFFLFRLKYLQLLHQLFMAGINSVIQASSKISVSHDICTPIAFSFFPFFKRRLCNKELSFMNNWTIFQGALCRFVVNDSPFKGAL